MKTVIDIINSGGHFLIILLGIGVICYIIQKIVDVVSKKKEKREKKEKKKKKKEPIKRMRGGFFSCREEVTEQEYVDDEFKNIRKQLDSVEEELEIFRTLTDKEYVFILSHGGLQLKGEDERLTPEEGRKWAKENDYSYIKSFKERGELWIKEEKKK